jgi:hypothetical protein
MIAATLLPPVPVVAGTGQLDHPQQTPVNRNQLLELLINSKDCHAEPEPSGDGACEVLRGIAPQHDIVACFARSS